MQHLKTTLNPDKKLNNYKMKKILFLSPLPPPYYGSAMSSEMCLEILQKSKKFEVKNIKLNYSKDMSDIGRLNINKIKGIIKVSKKIKLEIKEFNPDIIYFVPATSGLGLIRDAYFVKQIKKTWRKEILFHIRSRITSKDWNNKIYQKLYKTMLSNQKVIVLDELLKKDLHNLTKDSNILILPNAIKNELTEPEFKRIIQKRKRQNSFNLLFLSNMDESKGWKKLLETCKILKELNIDFKCNFVGAMLSKKNEIKFKKFVSQNNLQDNVKYLGVKTGKEKNKILETSDMLIFPTEYKLETFGRVIIEAMMFGLPVIANGIASIPTIIQHGRTGFVLEKNSPEEIVNYIIKLRDRKLREKMGIIGRKRFLDEYEIENYAKRFEKIIF